MGFYFNFLIIVVWGGFFVHLRAGVCFALNSGWGFFLNMSRDVIIGFSLGSVVSRQNNPGGV